MHFVLPTPTRLHHPVRRWVGLLLALLLALTARAQYTELQKLPSPESGNTRFSAQVAVDGNVMVVSANQNDTDAEGTNFVDGAGAAFVYEKEGGTWVLKAKLLAPQRQQYGSFGRWVAVSGGTVAITHWQDDFDENGLNPVLGAGSVCLFEKMNGVWTLRQKLVTSDRRVGDELGRGLALDGNLLVAGSDNQWDAQNQNELNASGAAYVFERINGTWTQVQKLVPNDRESMDWFADGAVDVSGTTIVVGSRDNGTDANGNNRVHAAGAVYVFEKSGASWTQTAKLAAFDRQEYDRLGQQVAVSGNTLVTTATGQELDAAGLNPLSSAGAAYVFVKTGVTWALQAKLVADDRAANEDFAVDVDIQGNRIVVGGESPTDADGQNSLINAGAVYAFDRSGTTWTQTQKIVVSDRTNFGLLGQSVALSGTTLLAGSQRAPVEGAAYVFNLCAPTFTSTPTVSQVPVCAGATFRLSFTVQQSPCTPPGGLVAYLSDATGSFAAPTSLGPVSPGINTLTMPEGIPAGTGYRLRVVLGGAPVVGSVASAPFTVRGPAFASAPSVSLDNKCAGQAVRLSFSVTNCAFFAGNAFTLELSDAMGANFVSIPGTVNPGALNTVTIPAGTPAGTGYKLRVVSSNPALTSAASANFKVKACGTNREASSEVTGLRVVVSPNPSPEGRLRIAVSGAEGRALRVELFNGAGQSLREQTIPKAGEEDVLHWDITQQPAGLYLLRVTDGREAKTLKVLH